MFFFDTKYCSVWCCEEKRGKERKGGRREEEGWLGGVGIGGRKINEKRRGKEGGKEEGTRIKTLIYHSNE